jgi:phage terminase large subunit GpA-like protein
MTTLAPARLASAPRVVHAAWAEGWRLPEPLTVSEWAGRYRVLPGEGASEPGPWRNERTPYLVEIMDCLSANSAYQRVVFMKSTQVGGTEVLVNFLGYIMDHAPGAVMLIVPSLDMAKRHSQQRIGPSIAKSPRWSARVAKARSREATNSTLVKDFAGGILVIATANSSSGVRSMPARYLLADEVDEFESNLNRQGDALELAERRTTTYGRRRKIFVCSTPTIQGASLIEREFEASDQRHYELPCPHCDHAQALEIDQLTDDGQYLCTGCGRLIDEHYKSSMLAAGRWVARNPSSPIAGFHINALYSPIGLGDPWPEIARKRAEAASNPEKAVTFANTICGLPFASERQQVERRDLEGRAEEYLLRTVPDGGLILTAGVDVQHDRFAIAVYAWGRGERCWLVDYIEVDGDPTRQDGYQVLDEHLLVCYPKASGALLSIRCVFIDGGNWTEPVATFVRSREQRTVRVGSRHERQTVVLCRGRTMEQDGRVVYRPKRAEADWRGKTIARSVGVWGVGTNAAKTVLFGRLQRDGGLDDIDDRMLHFPSGLPPEYWTGLTSEYFDLRLRRWIKRKGARNEPVDVMVYAYAAALSPHVRLDKLQEHEWQQLQTLLEPEPDLFTRQGETPSPAAAVPVSAGPSAPRSLAGRTETLSPGPTRPPRQW